MLFIRWHGKVVEISQAPLEALQQSKEVLEAKTVTESPLYYAITEEIKKRQMPKATAS